MYQTGTQSTSVNMIEELDSGIIEALDKGNEKEEIIFNLDECKLR